MGRYFENLVYGTPWYLLSDTPDGRIVSEIHKGRTEAKNYQERSLALQEKAMRELTQLHGGQAIVRPEEFQREGTTHILQGLATEMQQLYQEQAGTTESIKDLTRITDHGFSQVHEDLEELRGPTYPQQPLSEVIQSQPEFLEALGAYTKGILNQGARAEVENIIRSKMSWKQLAEKVKKTLHFLARKNNDYPQEEVTIDTAIELLIDPAKLIITFHREQAFKELRILNYFASKYNYSVLRVFIQEATELLYFYDQSLKTPLSEMMLLRLAENGHLNDAAKHRVMERYPEARKDPSIATINYSLLDIAKEIRTLVNQNLGLIEQGFVGLDQRDQIMKQGAELIEQGETAERHRFRMIKQGKIANYHMARIVHNLTSTNETLLNLEDICHEFMTLVESGFNRIVGRMNNVDNELRSLNSNIILCHAAIISEIQNLSESVDELGLTIENAIEKCNRLLGKILNVLRKSHRNDARQHFLDGMNCLKSAEEHADIEDAYDAFKTGSERVKTSVENQYGAGLAAELLGKTDEAKSRYKKAARRAKGNERMIASMALERLGNIEYRMGNLQIATEYIDRAINKNECNNAAKIMAAKLRILIGEKEEATQILVELTVQAPEFLEKIKSDKIFVNIHEDICLKLWEEIRNMSPETSNEFLDQICDNTPDTAMQIFYLSRDYEYKLDSSFLARLLHRVLEDNKIDDAVEIFYEIRYQNGFFYQESLYLLFKKTMEKDSISCALDIFYCLCIDYPQDLLKYRIWEDQYFQKNQNDILKMLLESLSEEKLMEISQRSWNIQRLKLFFKLGIDKSVLLKIFISILETSIGFRRRRNRKEIQEWVREKILSETEDYMELWILLKSELDKFLDEMGC